MDLRVFRILAALWVPLLAVLVAAAAIVDAGDGWPVAGPILVGGVGLLLLAAIAWLRQRPIAPGDTVAYRMTVLTKLALVEGIGLVGFVVAIGFGPWWLSALGGALSLIGLGLAWPSVADRERHELLYLV